MGGGVGVRWRCVCCAWLPMRSEAGSKPWGWPSGVTARVFCAGASWTPPSHLPARQPPCSKTPKHAQAISLSLTTTSPFPMLYSSSKPRLTHHNFSHWPFKHVSRLSDILILLPTPNSAPLITLLDLSLRPRLHPLHISCSAPHSPPSTRVLAHLIALLAPRTFLLTPLSLRSTCPSLCSPVASPRSQRMVLPTLPPSLRLRSRPPHLLLPPPPLPHLHRLRPKSLAPNLFIITAHSRVAQSGCCFTNCIEPTSRPTLIEV